MALPAPSARLLDTLRQRVRADFRLGVYFVFGGLTVAVLLPITALRFAQGHTLLAVIELVIIAIILLVVRHAWRGGNLDRLGILVTLLMTSGGALISAISPVGLFWLFPIVTASAFLAPTWLVLPACFALIGFLLWEGNALLEGGQPLAMLGALFVNGVFASVFARHAGARRAQLEQMASLDALTGAENRRALEIELEIAIAGARRDGRPVALALIDLDHFKRVNDLHGHDVGDRVLQDFVRIVQASVRRTDRLFRFGGEEFVLLMPATDEIGFEFAMAKLRKALLELKACGEPVTVSVGGAILQAGENRDGWLGRADDALYRAKEGGRNRIEIDLPPD